jgi:hypothetical protein
MKVFGLGYLRSVANRAAYVHFASSLYFVYQVYKASLQLAIRDQGST